MSPTFRSLRVRSYRLYASGQLLANTGLWMQRVAQDWLVLELTDGSATALGIAVGLQFLPLLLFSMWGGGLADRFRRTTLVSAGGFGPVAHHTVEDLALVRSMAGGDTAPAIALWAEALACLAHADREVEVRLDLLR